MRIAHFIVALACAGLLAASSVRAGSDGDDLLREAVTDGDAGDVKDALANGARANLMLEGMPVIMYAAVQGDVKVVRALILGGANVNLRGKDGNTPLMAAVDMERGEVVEELLKARADPGLTDENGITALMRACITQTVAMIPVLVRNGAEVDQAIGNDVTALILCADKPKSVQALLAAGANPRGPAVDNAIAQAEKTGNKDFVATLRKAQAAGPVAFAVTPAPKVAVNDHVLGHLPNSGLWAPAKVQGVNGTQVTLVYDAGSDPVTMSARQTRPLDWKAGMRIACLSEGEIYWGILKSRDGDKLRIAWGNDTEEDTTVASCRSAWTPL